MKYHNMDKVGRKSLLLGAIKSVRHSVRFTQTDMALYLGLLPSAYSRTEGGTRKLTADEFIQILELVRSDLIKDITGTLV